MAPVAGGRIGVLVFICAIPGKNPTSACAVKDIKAENIKNVGMWIGDII